MSESPALRRRNLHWLWLFQFYGETPETIAGSPQLSGGMSRRTIALGIRDALTYAPRRARVLAGVGQVDDDDEEGPPRAA